MTSQVQTANCRKNDLESLFLLAWVQQIRQCIEVLEEELHVTKISIYILQWGEVMLGGDIIAIQQQDMSTMNVQKQRIRTVAVAIRGGLQIPVDLNKKHVQALKV